MISPNPPSSLHQNPVLPSSPVPPAVPVGYYTLCHSSWALLWSGDKKTLLQLPHIEVAGPAPSRSHKCGHSNKVAFTSREDAISAGYAPCKVCYPWCQALFWRESTLSFLSAVDRARVSQGSIISELMRVTDVIQRMTPLYEKSVDWEESRVRKVLDGENWVRRREH